MYCPPNLLLIHDVVCAHCRLLFSLCHAYGTGAEDIFNGGFELIAWRDFVEDVEKAYPDKDNVWEESQIGRGDQWIPDDGSTVVGQL